MSWAIETCTYGVWHRIGGRYETEIDALRGGAWLYDDRACRRRYNVKWRVVETTDPYPWPESEDPTRD
jgi:hypothetical protein